MTGFHWLHDRSIIRRLAFKCLIRVKKEERDGLHDHSLEVVGSRVGIETYICSVNASQIQIMCFELALVTFLVGKIHRN